MKKNTLTYVLTLGFISAVIFFSVKGSSEYKEIKAKGIIVESEVTTFGSDIYVEWEINGRKKQKRMSKPVSTIQSGEKFVTYWLITYPDKCYVDFENPIIENEHFSETDCIEIKRKQKDIIMFTYEFNQKIYKRFIRNSSYDLNENKDFVVLYKTDNPRIAYVKKK